MGYLISSSDSGYGVSSLTLGYEVSNGNQFGYNVTLVTSNWILATGFWNDDGVWDDFAEWID